MTPELLDALIKAREEKRAAALITDLDSGQQTLLYPLELDVSMSDALTLAARQAVVDDRPARLQIDDRTLFINIFNPPLRLIIVGAVHAAQPLSIMANLCGYDVSIIDPRTAFASAERFPGIALHHDWPDSAMTTLSPDHRTAVVLLTHDPKLDDPALHVALTSPAFYIGALGSKKTHAARLERLAKAGFSAAQIARIHGPVGLNIAAKSPGEIAISIMAEITRDLRQGAV
jgi:xanthine dehydrogenase accessory factor